MAGSVKRPACLIAAVAIVGCAAGELAAPPASSTTSTTIATTTTTSSVVVTTTTLTPVVTVRHGIRVYEGYEATASFEVGQPCLTVGELNPLRVGNRVIVWNETGDSIITSGELGGGTIEYDLSGPPLEDGGSNLFFFCSFTVTLPDLPTDGAVRFEFPGSEDLSGTVTVADLYSGNITIYANAELESERQRIRVEQ